MNDRFARKRLSLLFVLLTCPGLLVGCQPTPEDRIGRAAAFMEEGEYRAAVIELKNALRRDSENVDARLLLAKSSAQLGDLPTAISEYERALGLGNTDESNWIGLGRALLEQGRASEVLERVLPNLDEEGASLESLLLQGDVMTVLGNIEDAATLYSTVLEADATNEKALVGMAVVASARRQPDSASQYIKRATDGNPDSAFAWRAAANFARTRRDYAAAADAFGKSVTRETVHTSLTDRLITRVNHAGVLLDDRQFDAAAPLIDQISDLLPGHPLVNYLRGRLAYGLGNFDEAQSYLQEYLSQMPNDFRGHAVLGAVNFSQNHFRQAEMYLRQAANQNVGGDLTRRLLAETQLRLNKPGDALASLDDFEADALDDPILLMMLGRAQLGLGNNAAAVKYLEQSASVDPDNPATQLSLAAGLLVAGDADRAVELLNNFPDFDDREFKRETLLIAAHLKRNDPESAIAVSEALVSDNAGSPEAHVVAALLYQSLGDNAKAGTLYQKGVDLDANSLKSIYGLGHLAMVSRDAEQAESLFSRALDVDAAYMPALLRLTQLLASMGRFDDLQPRIQAAIVANPASATPYVVNARAAIATGRYPDALKIVDEARKSHDDVPLLDHAEGLALVKNTGQVELGLRKLALAATAAPDVAVVHRDLARYRLSAGDYSGSATAIERFRELQPDNLKGLFVRCQALALDGNAAQARHEVAGFRASHGESVDLVVLEGDIEMNDQQPAEAVRYYAMAAEQIWSRSIVLRLTRASQAAGSDHGIEALKRWLDEHPEDLPIRRYYAQILESRGESTEAATQYERILGQSADDAVSLNNLAWTYSQEGKPGAVELAERAHELLPDNGNISDTLGWVLYRDGQLERAEEILRQAAVQAPENPEIKYHLATVLVETGQNGEAKSLLTELLDDEQQFSSRDKAEELARSL